MPVVPIVALEIPAEIAPDLAATALRTCNLALGNGHCVSWEASSASTDVKWLAHVGMDPTQPQQLRIELRDAQPQSKRTTFSRLLGFEPSDVPAHRWSTAGVVVAALVISAESNSAEVPEARPHGGLRADATAANDAQNHDGTTNSTVTATTQTKGSNSEGARLSQGDRGQEGSALRRALRLELGVAAGPSVEGFALRQGLLVRPAYELSPNLFLWTEFSGSRAQDDLSIFWWSGAAGVGLAAEIIAQRLALEGRAFIAGERLEFTVTNAAGESDSARRWRYGAGVGIDTVLAFSQALGWFVGVDGVLERPRVRIRRSGDEVGETPTVSARISTGLRWRIPLGR